MSCPFEHKVPLSTIFYKDAYNFHRRAKIMLLLNLLHQDKEFTERDKEAQYKLVQKIERACYNNTISIAEKNNIATIWDNPLFIDIYNDECSRITHNIDNEGLVNNANFKQKILEGKNIVENVKKSSIEIFPEKYENITQRINTSKTVSLTVKKNSTYTCRKCFATETRSDNLYNRSLDEGTNLRIECLKCGHKWNG